MQSEFLMKLAKSSPSSNSKINVESIEIQNVNLLNSK